MFRRLARTAISLLVVSASYWLYATFAVPWIEPQVTSAEDPAQSPPPPPSSRTNQFASLFPEDSWQRTNPKVLETEQGLLLFRDYQPTVDGHVELKPVTLVFQPKARGEKSKSRYMILDAPDGALLTFDSPLDLTRARMGKFLGGRLLGEIRIYSPPSEPMADDAIHVQTRNVQLDDRHIWTTQSVQFRFGPHHGSGRDLRIDLATSKDANRDAAGGGFAAVSSLELATVDKIYLQMKGDGLFGGEDGKPKTPRKSAPPVPVEVTCRGPFKFDFQSRIASLNDRVEALRLNLDGPADQLTCEVLAIHFDSTQTTADKSSNPAMKIARFTAQGHPVRLQAPSVDAFAEAESVAYNFVTRRIRLDDSRQIKLRHKSFDFQAPSLEYELGADPKRLGRMWAAGPGQFQSHLPEPESTRNEGDRRSPEKRPPPVNEPRPAEFPPMSATWQRELRIETDGDRHVLSLLGETIKPDDAAAAHGVAIQPATIESTGMGWFAAGQLHVWMRDEFVATNAADASRNAQASRYSLAPEQVLATDRVEFDSAEMSGGVQRLEVTFRDGPVGGRLVPVAEHGSATTSPAERRELFGAGGGASRQKFDVRGDLAQIFVVRDGKAVAAEQATMVGNVRVTQVYGTKPGKQPLVIAGDELQLHGLSENAVQAMVIGQPAAISADGLTLSGPAVQLDQSRNLLWINGGGEMTLAGELLAPGSRDTNGREQPSARGESASPARLRWTGEMVFDGTTLRCEQFVQLDGQHRFDSGNLTELSVRGDVAEATLTRPIDFRRPDRERAADLLTVVIRGKENVVAATSRTFDLAGSQQSFDQLQARRLTINKPTGQFDTAGPGWVSTVRYLSDPLRAKSSAGSASAAPYLQTKLTYLRVNYQRAIVGNFQSRELQFIDQVAAVSGPVRTWDDVVEADRLERLRDDEKRLTCDRLTVVELTNGRHRWLELDASGNTYAEGRTESGYFTARAQRASYTQAKDLLVLESNGREDARLTRQVAIGSPESNVTARKIEFRPKTNELNLDGIGSINVSDLPNSPRR